MRTAAPDPLVDGYLKRLRAAARELSRTRRDELVQQIQEHLQEAVPPGASETEIRNALEHLGEPETIIAEEFERRGTQSARGGKLEWITVMLLPLGFAVIPILGWAIAVILLWRSRVWSTGEKLLGTLLPPGGLSVILVLLVTGSSSCTEAGGAGRPTIERCTGGLPGAVGVALLIAFVITGIATPTFLARRAAASRT
jgi:hypothetical protein